MTSWCGNFLLCLQMNHQFVTRSLHAILTSSRSLALSFVFTVIATRIRLKLLFIIHLLVYNSVFFKADVRA